MNLLVGINMWKQIIVFCAFIAVALSALAIAPLEPKPDKFKNTEGCYLKDIDSVIPFGQAAPSRSSCLEYRCSPGSVTYVSCGAVAVSPPCKLVEDKGKPYPNCCPKIHC